MGNLNEQLDRIKQMILFKEGMSFKDVKHLTEADKESVENGAEMEISLGGAATKSAAASKGVSATSGVGGMEITDSDRGFNMALKSGEVSDEGGDIDIVGVDMAKGEKIADVGLGANEIEAFSVIDDSGQKITDLRGGDEDIEDMLSVNRLEDIEKNVGISVVDLSDEEIETVQAMRDEKEDMPQDNFPDDFMSKDEEKAAKEAAKEALLFKDEMEGGVEDLKQVEFEDETEESPFSAAAPSAPEKTPEDKVEQGEVEQDEVTHVAEEIIFIQLEMINYLESGGSPDDEEYHDLVNHHEEMKMYYEELSQGQKAPEKTEEEIYRDEEDAKAAKEAPHNLQDLDIRKASTGGLTYEIDMAFGGIAPGQGMKVGAPKLTTNKDGTVTFKANVIEHEKYPTPATLEGYLSKDSRVFYIEYLTPDGDSYNRYKAPVFDISRSAGKEKSSVSSSPSVSKLSDLGRGSFEAPLGMVGTSGKFGAVRAKTMGPFNQDPWAEQGKVDPTRWKENKYDKEKDEKKKKKELSESRRARAYRNRRIHESGPSTKRNIVKLKEADLYNIIDKVIAEKRNNNPKGIKEDWMKNVSKEIKKDHTGGSFRNWCEKHGFDSGCSDECIHEALKTDDTLLHYRAGLAKAFCGADHHRNESRRPRRTLQEKKEGKAYCSDSPKGCIRKRAGKWVILDNNDPKLGVWRKCDSEAHCKKILGGLHTGK